MRSWPYWKHKEDGRLLTLTGFATYNDEIACYVLLENDSGMTLVTPMPGMQGSMIEQDTSDERMASTDQKEIDAKLGYDDNRNEEDGS